MGHQHQVCHAHCPKGGGGLAAVLVIVVVLIVAATARPVVHAAEDVLEVVFIAAAAITTLVVLGATTYVALRLRRRHARNRQAISRHAPVAQRTPQALSAPRRRAIENTRRAIPGVVVRDEITERR